MDLTRYKFFFVCGHSRSGTTWVAKVLDLHPRIKCRGEFHFEVLRAGFDEFVSRPFHLARRGPMHDLAEQCFQDTVRRLMACPAGRRRKPRVEWLGDRTPRPLRDLLPGSRCPHIYMHRDGRDVAVSYTIHQLRTRAPDASAPRWCERLEPLRRGLRDNPRFFKDHPERLFEVEPWVRHAARKWARRVRNDLAAADRMRDDGVPVRVYRYEDMRADPEATRRDMYAFLGADPAEAAPLEPGRTAAGFSAENPAGKDRRGDVGDWINYAVGGSSERFRRAFKEEANDVLIRLGYEEGDRW
jgi:hypothetical protein